MSSSRQRVRQGWENSPPRTKVPREGPGGLAGREGLQDVCARPGDSQSSLLSLAPEYLLSSSPSSFHGELWPAGAYWARCTEGVYSPFFPLWFSQQVLVPWRLWRKSNFPGHSATFINLMGKGPAYFLVHVISIILFNSPSLHLLSTVEQDLQVSKRKDNPLCSFLWVGTRACISAERQRETATGFEGETLLFSSFQALI